MQTLAFLLLRIDLLEYLPLVLVDKTVGCIDDVLRRTVVTLQFEELGSLIAVLEVQYVLYRCPAETVYTLRIITYDTYMVLRFSQQFDYQVLRMVGVLVLIHQHVPEPLLVALAHLAVVTQ